MAPKRFLQHPTADRVPKAPIMPQSGVTADCLPIDKWESLKYVGNRNLTMFNGDLNLMAARGVLGVGWAACAEAVRAVWNGTLVVNLWKMPQLRK